MNWAIILYIYCTVANAILAIILINPQDAFMEFRKSTEKLRKQSFTMALLSYAGRAILYSYSWIIALPLAFFLLRNSKR